MTEWLPIVKPSASSRASTLAALLAVLAGDPLRDDEERRRDVVLLERVDHRRRGLGVRAVVERERDDAVALLAVDRVGLPTSDRR